MHIRIRYQHHTLLVVLMGVRLVTLGACSRVLTPAVTPPPTIQPSPTSAELPAFLSDTYPEPTETVVQWTSSVRLIWATLYLEEILRPGETPEPEAIQGRTEFMLDGELMDVEIVQRHRPDAADIVDIVGTLNPSVGEHKATVRVRGTSDEVLEYSWTFTVVANEPPLPDAPEVFAFVRPLPDSTITWQSYREEQLVPSYYAPPLDMRGSVCVGVRPGEVTEPGERLDGGDIARRYGLVALDGVLPDRDVEMYGICGLAKFTVTDESGLVTSYPGPDHCKCWRVELAPGEHVVTVQARQTSGEAAEYTWRFTITSD